MIAWGETFSSCSDTTADTASVYCDRFNCVRCRGCITGILYVYDVLIPYWQQREFKWLKKRLFIDLPEQRVDWPDIRAQQEQHYKLLITRMANVYPGRYHRRTPLSKSGFMARAGKRRKS